MVYSHAKLVKKLGRKPSGPPKTLLYHRKRYIRHSKGWGNLGAARSSAWTAEQYYEKVIIVSYLIKWKSTRREITTYAVYKRTKRRRKK